MPKRARRATFYCLGIVALILAPSPEYLVLASILGMGLGGIGGTALTTLLTMWWEAVPTESRVNFMD